MPDRPPNAPDEGDVMIARIADALRPLPHVDAEARARVLVAVAAERARDAEAVAPRGGSLRWRRAAVPAAVAAILLLALTLLPREAAVPPAPLAATTAAVAAPARMAAHSGAEAATAAQAVQLVFRAPEARRVAVVGDFTGWDDASVPMTRDPASGLWNATVLVRPGRHVYAFVVDDSLWVRDPRAPVVTDADFGRPGSLLLVGQP